VDKSINPLSALRIKWWPGRESNTRHADFQGVQRLTHNHLMRKGAENTGVLRTSGVVARFDAGKPANAARFSA
jgi:hypothetical protein